jgi:hypothetical protein
MNATNTQVQTQAKVKTITIHAVARLAGAEESPTLWLGRGRNGKEARDLRLSSPIPRLSEDEVLELAASQGAKLAEFLTGQFEDYIYSVKAQRMVVGDSMQVELPAGEEYAPFILHVLTAGGRTRKMLTQASILQLRKNENFQTMWKAWAASQNIAANVFETRALDIFLNPCYQANLTFDVGMMKAYERAIFHFRGIADSMKGESQEKNILLAAIGALESANWVDSSEGL